MESRPDRRSKDTPSIFVPGSGRTSRRDFLKTSAAAAAAAAIGPTAGAMGLSTPAYGEGNLHPGRIVRYHDPAMNGHGTIDRDRVEEVVHHAAQILTGESDTARAFETLFPDLTSTTTIAIKVNCIGPCDTRWEVARAVVKGLSLMINGTYKVDQITIFDRHDLGSHGYTTEEFTFNGRTPYITGNNDANSGYYVWQNHQLSNHILNADYVINIPALKSHNEPLNMITVAMKNHYGSCSPASLCGDIPGMQALNSDINIKEKTALVVTSALKATYNGGPGTAPQYWFTFPDGTPNTILMTTDPVTNEYWSRDMINHERTDPIHDWDPKLCPWIEQASGVPYQIGVSNPDDMTVFHLDATDVDAVDPVVGGTFLIANAPNPFTNGTMLRFRLEKAGTATLQIVGPTGRIVRELGDHEFSQGYQQLKWDGRDAQGRRVPAGVYFVRMGVGSLVRTRRIIAAH